MILKDKRILVTGGARRIGRAICELFAANGARMVVHYHRSANDAEALCRKLSGTGHETLQCDLADPEATSNVLQRCGEIDVLINNAAVFEATPLLDETDAALQRHLQINFLAPLSLTKQFIVMRGQRPGCVVNILDHEVAGPVGRGSGYSVSKRALRDIVAPVALQAAPWVRVNAVAPGPTLPPESVAHSKMAETLKMMPLGRAVSPADVAAACLFLVENESITGQVVYVDGGRSLIQDAIPPRQ